MAAGFRPHRDNGVTAMRFQPRASATVVREEMIFAPVLADALQKALFRKAE